MKITHIWS